jgi:hypothetical protein
VVDSEVAKMKIANFFRTMLLLVTNRLSTQGFSNKAFIIGGLSLQMANYLFAVFGHWSAWLLNSTQFCLKHWIDRKWSSQNWKLGLVRRLGCL